jgi:hypothetical protein
MDNYKDFDDCKEWKRDVDLSVGVITFKGKQNIG